MVEGCVRGEGWNECMVYQGVEKKEEHNRGGWERSSESSDSKAAKGLRWKKRETGLGETIVGRRGKVA